jgi:hypothetical protein
MNNVVPTVLNSLILNLNGEKSIIFSKNLRLSTPAFQHRVLFGANLIRFVIVRVMTLAKKTREHNFFKPGGIELALIPVIGY